MIDARPQTGTAPDEQTEMRYPTRASELDHRRLQVPPSLLHDPSTNQLHAGARRTSQSCARCLTKDIRETGPAGGPSQNSTIAPTINRNVLLFRMRTKSRGRVRWPNRFDGAISSRP